MKKNTVVGFAGFILAGALTIMLLQQHVFSRASSPADSLETGILNAEPEFLSISGKEFKIADGKVYQRRKGKWIFIRNWLRPGLKYIYFKKTPKGYEAVNTETGDSILLSRHFSSGFEAPSYRKLFRANGWNTMTLLSPKANTVKKHSRLHSTIMKGGKFLDNRLDLETKNVHAGKYSLRCYSVKPESGMVTCKSLLEKKELGFGNGDHIWFSGWYFIEKGMPATLVDFEAREVLGGPGMRLIIKNRKYASMELKFADKPQYNQVKVSIPHKKWVHFKLHLRLSHKRDGVIELWQDGEKILSEKGRTLPTRNTLYTAMQVGVTATPRETVLLVDDVIISNKPF